MKYLFLLFSVLLSTSLYGQIGPDGTGTVNGYSIGPGADLSDADLSFADLSNANLPNANLSGADLSSANLSGADLSGADLYFANLPNANLSDAILTGADLSDAILTRAVLFGVISGNIYGTPTLPSGYQMINGYIVGAGVDLTGADLTGTDLTGANLSDARFIEANLINADLSGANLEGADLSGADLSGADLRDALLWGTIWSNVISQSDYDAVVAERDAALAAQASAEAERDAKLTLDEVKDLRAGSTMIEIDNGQATLSMEVEESDDLGVWTNESATTIQITKDAEAGKKFFRFKMVE